MRLFAYLNVDSPWVAWMVYRGEMVSPKASGTGALSLWHAKYLIDLARECKRNEYYKREMAIEYLRHRSFSDKVSRLSGLYFFEDMESARRAGQRWDGNFQSDFLAEIEVVGAPRVSRYDSQWISDAIYSNDISWIPSYLSGIPMGKNPLWELLIEGRGFILGTSIRKRAYETVKRTWPRSLGLLEVSRVAVELDSDLGLIFPFLRFGPAKVELRFELNFVDATNEAFLAKFSNYDGPKNTADMNASADLILPDLSNHFVEFSI